MLSRKTWGSRMSKFVDAFAADGASNTQASKAFFAQMKKPRSIMCPRFIFPDYYSNRS
jgi:hypothetical protein